MTEDAHTQANTEQVQVLREALVGTGLEEEDTRRPSAAGSGELEASADPGAVPPVP